MMKEYSTYQGARLFAFFIFLMLFSISVGGGQSPPPSTTWDKNIIDQGAYYSGGIAIGDGRNNGSQRLYCASMNGDLVEYRWNGSGGWIKETIAVGQEYEGIVVGPGRNDGNNLYCYKEDQLFELIWTGAAWTIPQVIFTSPFTQLDFVIIGPGRNDGRNRIYASNKRNEIYELNYPLGGPFETAPTMEYDMQAHDIGIGRNDGVYRIYGVGRDPGDKAPHVYELTYLGGSPLWESQSIERWTSVFPDIPSEVSLLDVAVGDGRGDGVNRIYRIDDLGNIFEFTWITDGPTDWWGRGPIVAHGEAGYGTRLTEWGNSFAIGPRRSDPARSRIYIGATDDTNADSSRVYEFTYYVGPPCAVPEGCWERIEVGVQGAHGINVELGELRGPGQIGIYAVTIEGHIVEFFEK